MKNKLLIKIFFSFCLYFASPKIMSVTSRIDRILSRVTAGHPTLMNGFFPLGKLVNPAGQGLTYVYAHRGHDQELQ